MNIDPSAMLALVHATKRSPLRNYCMPGLTSWLLTEPSEQGCLRLLEATRDIDEWITPHSHRFDLRCTVLEAEVTNIIFTPHSLGDDWCATKLVYKGTAGKYTQSPGGVLAYEVTPTTYGVGETYRLNAEVVHRITFRRGAIVLMEEGHKKYDHTTILEPFIDQARVPTFRVEPWMFKSE